MTPRRWWPLLVAVVLAAPLQAEETPEKTSPTTETEPEPEPEKLVIGGTALVFECSTGIGFPARIDTGGESCSLHVEEVRIEDPHKDIRKNIDKPARIRVRDPEGKDHWIDTKIAETVKVRTSEEEERRYKVWLTLKYAGVEKRVHVTLNDRSRMVFPLLVGRNFLRGDFLVDVADEKKPGKLIKL